MKLEVGQVWQLDTQEEFDAFVKLKDEQGIEWFDKLWTFEKFASRKTGLSLFRSCFNHEVVCGSSGSLITHYGKDLLKEVKMFKVGDRVKVLKHRKGLSKSYVGKVGTIKRVDKDSIKMPYRIEFNSESFWMIEPELELVSKSNWREVEREENTGPKNGTFIVEQNTKTKELRVTTGFFKGTLGEFEVIIKRRPEGDKWRIICEWLIEKYKTKYPDYKKKIAYVVKLNDKSYLYKNSNGSRISLTFEKTNAFKFYTKEMAEEEAALYGGKFEEFKL